MTDKENVSFLSQTIVSCPDFCEAPRQACLPVACRGPLEASGNETTYKELGGGMRERRVADCGNS
jgi:hypothetical protein